jgi:hypothetical protein
MGHGAWSMELSAEWKIYILKPETFPMPHGPCSVLPTN